MGSGPRESRYEACSWETDDDVVVDKGITGNEQGANATTDEAETAAIRADASFIFQEKVGWYKYLANRSRPIFCPRPASVSW